MRRRRLSRLSSRTHTSAFVAPEQLEDRQMLDASGAIAEAAGFDYFESREALAEHLIQRALDGNEHRFGQTVYPYSRYEFYSGDNAEFGLNSIQVSAFTSDTNQQVVGVDEQDIIENDGEYLYLIQDGDLVIVDAADPESLNVASRVEIEGAATSIFLHEKTLTVIANDWQTDAITSANWFISPGRTRVTTFDVTDASEPRLTRETTLDGWFVDARAIDGKVHVFTTNDVNLPEPRRVPIDSNELPSNETGETFTAESGHVFVSRLAVDYEPTEQYESRETYEAYLRENIDQFVDDALPSYETIDASGVSLTGLLSDFDEIAFAAEDPTGSLLSVVTIDTNPETTGLTGSTSVFTSASGQRYATKDHLYLSNSEYVDGVQQTRILQFSWATEEDNVRLIGSGAVDGVLLNQFAMDEYEGHLRVATTTRDWTSTERVTANNVFVLKNVDGQLTTVGSIEGFEQGETIFAVRFSGDRGFVVTFQRIDPLFMIDLSDPASPEITGELEVPGFSSYLQRIDDDHLLALGEINNTPKVTIYNISDPANPTLVDEDILPQFSRTSFSDHQQFRWFEEHSTVAIPVRSSAGGYSSGLLLYTVDTTRTNSENVIRSTGTVSSDRNISRSSFIEDVLYTITDRSVTATDFTGEETFGELNIDTDEAEEPHRFELYPFVEILKHGTSSWRPLTSQGAGGSKALEDSETQQLVIVLPETTDDESVSVTMFGDTLTIESAAGEEVYEISSDTRLRIVGTAADDNVVVDFENSANVLASFQLDLGDGDDVAVVGPTSLSLAKIYGGSGNDSIDGSSSGRLHIFGGAGNDTLTGSADEDTIFGGQGDDSIRGGAGHDRLVGQQGTDRIWGEDGSDSITGGRSDDKLYGGRGNDTLRGGRGNDRVFGSTGADHLYGNQGDDYAIGNHGRDILHGIDTASDGDVFSGGNGVDRFVRGDIDLQTVLDRLFDFRENEDLITELWSGSR